MYDRIVRSIFANGEQGFAYDPNDLTDAKINWRRNLLTETEFKNGVADAQVKGGSYAAAPFDGLTAGTGIQINLDAINGTYVYKTFATTVGVTYVFSFYVRMLDGTPPVVGEQNFDGAADFCIVAEGGLIYNPNRSIVDLGGGLYRVIGRVTSAITQTPFGVVKYAGNSARSFVVSGYQLEVGSAVSQYQSLTDFNSDFYAAFPQHALYQDATGTIPVTASGQPVGLMLDKSKSLQLSGELFNNDTVLTTAGVTYLGDSTYRIVTDSALQSLEVRGIPLGLCLFDYTIISTAAGSLRIDAQDVGYQHKIVGSGNKRHLLRNSRGNIAFVRDVVPTDITIRINSIKQLLGNHAYQATSSMRPLLRQTPILGYEHVVNGNFASDVSGWSPSVSTTVTHNAGKARITATASVNATMIQLLPNIAGKTVDISVTLAGRAGGTAVSVLLRSQAANYTAGSAITVGSDGILNFRATTPSDFVGGLYVRLDGATVGQYVDIDDVTVRDVTGYTTTQNYLDFDAVDDLIATNAFVLPLPFSSMHTVRTTKLQPSTQAILSGGAAGYLYTARQTSFALQQESGSPQVGVERSVADVLYHSADAAGVALKSNTAAVYRTDLIYKTPYASNLPKVIGSFTTTPQVVAGMRYYGGILVGRVLTVDEELAVRRLFNERIAA